MKHREGAVELATLGSGHHFIELQADEEGALWLMLHSGSRAMGQAIRRHHAARAPVDDSGMRSLEAESLQRQAYLSDVAWALAYAEESRASCRVRWGRGATTSRGAGTRRRCDRPRTARGAMSRTEARRRISVRVFEREVHGVWFDHRLASELRNEAPSAYKDIRGVIACGRWRPFRWY